MGDDGFMMPDEASRFYEEDEDPQKIFARFDAGPKSVTSTPTYAGPAPASSTSIYFQAAGLYRELRRKALPMVSAAGPKSYAMARALHSVLRSIGLRSCFIRADHGLLPIARSTSASKSAVPPCLSKRSNNLLKVRGEVVCFAIGR